MTTSLFMSYVHAMPRIRAERLLDAASAAGGPYQKGEWWDSLSMRAHGGDVAASVQSSPFSLNGVRMPVAVVKAALGVTTGVVLEAASR